MPLSTFVVIHSTPIWGVKDVRIILLWVLTYFKIILSPKVDIYPSIRGFSMIIEFPDWIFMLKSFWDSSILFPWGVLTPLMLRNTCWSMRGFILNTGYCEMYFNYKMISNIKYHNYLSSSIGDISKKYILSGNILDWILSTFLFWFTNPIIFILLT